MNDSYVISPRVVNNLVVTFNRTNNYNFHILPPNYASLGITDVYNDDVPQWVFNVNGYFGINTGDTNTFLRNEFQVVNTTRWSLGKHDLAFGADYAYGQGDIVNNFRANGRYTFSTGRRPSPATRWWTSCSASSRRSSRASASTRTRG